MRIRGRLTRGLGTAPEFTRLPWVVEQCRSKLGFEPFPGTVNLQVLAEDLDLWKELKGRAGTLLSPPDGASCDASCQRVTIEDAIVGATVVPHVPGYPSDKLELLAPCAVVDALHLTVGQTVSIEA